MSAIEVGQRASVTRRFAVADLDAYVALGGAVDSADRVPEPLIGALFSYLLGVELPGSGTMYLKQHTHYEAPAYLTSSLTATVTVTALRPDKHLVDLATECRDDGGRQICHGRALVRFDAL